MGRGDDIPTVFEEEEDAEDEDCATAETTAAADNDGNALGEGSPPPSPTFCPEEDVLFPTDSENDTKKSNTKICILKVNECFTINELAL